MFVIPMFVTVLPVSVNHGRRANSTFLLVVHIGTSVLIHFTLSPPPCLQFFLHRLAAGYINLLIADILSA
jgi:hypothetical protein